jgi:hypothetical protein
MFPPIPGVHTPLGSEGDTREEGAAGKSYKVLYDAAPGAIATHEMSAAPEVRSMDIHMRTVTTPTNECTRRCAPRKACWPGIMLLYILNMLSLRSVQGGNPNPQPKPLNPQPQTQITIIYAVRMQFLGVQYLSTFECPFCLVGVSACLCPCAWDARVHVFAYVCQPTRILFSARPCSYVCRPPRISLRLSP